MPFFRFGLGSPLVRVIAAALVLAIGSGVASAQEADAPPEAPRFVPLAELVSLIHLKEWVVSGHAPLVDGDRQALRDAHIARLDAFIGSMRRSGSHGPRIARSQRG